MCACAKARFAARRAFCLATTTTYLHTSLVQTSLYDCLRSVENVKTPPGGDGHDHHRDGRENPTPPQGEYQFEREALHPSPQPPNAENSSSA